jgi:hypothetical protein
MNKIIKKTKIKPEISIRRHLILEDEEEDESLKEENECTRSKENKESKYFRLFFNTSISSQH